MARKSNIAQQLAVVGSDDDADTYDSPAETPAKATKAASRPRKSSGGRGAAKKGSASSQTSQSPAPDAGSGGLFEEVPMDQIRVLGESNDRAKRGTLYLHPEDHRAVGSAKLEDGADLNARVRAMIALWRHNARFRHQVDRLARTAPRGGGR